MLNWWPWLLFSADDGGGGGSDGSDGADDGDNADDGDSDDDGDEEVKVSKGEYERLRRKVGEAEKARKKAEAEVAKHADAEAKEQGKFKELAETAERERDEAKAELAKVKLHQRIVRVATQKKMRDPDDAVRNLDDIEDDDDDRAIGRAIEDLKKTKPHLFAQERKRRGGEIDEPDRESGGMNQRIREMAGRG